MDRTLLALLRSSHAQAAYDEALERAGSRGSASTPKRLSAFRAEVEAADADVTLLRQELLGRGMSDDSGSETRLVATKS